VSYDRSNTAILLLDPYNDFLRDGGKLWPRVKKIAGQVDLLNHLREVISAARSMD
jgi:nicotinamidase-related amidase